MNARVMPSQHTARYFRQPSRNATIGKSTCSFKTNRDRDTPAILGLFLFIAHMKRQSPNSMMVALCPRRTHSQSGADTENASAASATNFVESPQLRCMTTSAAAKARLTFRNQIMLASSGGYTESGTSSGMAKGG